MRFSLNNDFIFPTGSDKKFVILSVRACSSSQKFYYDVDYQIKNKSAGEIDELNEDISFCLFLEEIEELLKQ